MTTKPTESKCMGYRSAHRVVSVSRLKTKIQRAVSHTNVTDGYNGLAIGAGARSTVVITSIGYRMSHDIFLSVSIINDHTDHTPTLNHGTVVLVICERRGILAGAAKLVRVCGHCLVSRGGGV